MDVFVEKGYFRITDAGVKIESLLEQLAGAEDVRASCIVLPLSFRC